MRRVLFAGALGSLTIAATAGAEVRTGSASSPAEPDTIANGARDIVGLSASYDTSGSVSATVTLREPPNQADATTAIFAEFGPATLATDPYCDPPKVIVGGVWTFDPIWASDPAGSDGAAAREVAGNAVTFSASASDFADQSWLCASAVTLAVGNPATVVDNIEVVVPLAGPPPPPPQPALELALDASVEVKRGRTAKVPVQVSNPGTGPATGVKLKVSEPGGVTVKPRKKKLQTIGAGETKTVRIKVKTGKRTKQKSKLKVSAKGADGLHAKGKVTVVLARKSGGGSPGSPEDLAGRYFWGFKTAIDQGWDNHGIYFVDSRNAYLGFPEQGLPTRCPVPTSEGPKDCVRYSYNRKSGKLSIDGKQASFDAKKYGGRGSIEFDDVVYGPLEVPKPGATFAVNLIHQNFFGCLPATICSTVTKTLTLDRSGTFVKTSSSVTTTPFRGATGPAPNETGTYAIGPRGKITFKYADGAVEVATIGLDAAENGDVDPARVGLLLNDVNYYFDDD
jgi:hypothetical protein